MGYVPKSSIAGPTVIRVLEESPHHSPQHLHHFTLTPAMHKASDFCTFNTCGFLLAALLYYCPPGRCEVVPRRGSPISLFIQLPSFPTRHRVTEASTMLSSSLHSCSYLIQPYQNANIELFLTYKNSNLVVSPNPIKCDGVNRIGAQVTGE